MKGGRTMSIYYVRHGQTDWNLQGYLQGQSDIPLNETGMKQAYEVNKAMKKIKIEKLYCSPLKRTRKTAEIINENWGLPIFEDARLLERNFGEKEGAHKSTYPFASFWVFDQPSEFQMETIEELFARVYDFLDEIQEEAKSKNILIVAHGGVSIPFQCYFDEEKRNGDPLSLILSNCEIAREESKDTIQG